MEKGGTVRSGFCCNKTFHVGENQNRIQNEISNENVIKERKVPLPICQMEKEKLPEKLPKLRNRPLLLLCLPAHPRLQRSLLPKKSNLSPSHLYLLSSPSSILYLSRALLIFTMPCNTIPCNTLPCHTIQYHVIFTSPQMLIFKLYQLHSVLCIPLQWHSTM